MISRIWFGWTTTQNADAYEKLLKTEIFPGIIAKKIPGLRKIELGNLKLIFIENIGNLICPAEFPLGSKARVVVVSVTEGPWMVRKHPHMFLGAEIVVINKIDLTQAMEVSVEDLVDDVHKLKPDIKVIPTSTKTGAGLDEFEKALLAV